MSMTLYELSNNYRLLSEIDDENLQDTLEAIQDSIEVKVENIVKVMRNFKLEEEAIKAEEERLSKRRKSVENKREALQSYIQQQLEVSGLSKVKSSLFTVYMQNNPPSVNVIDEKMVPAEYLKVSVIETLDKKQILDDARNGKSIEGVEIRQTKSLRVR